MKTTNWKDNLELVGIVAIIASLIFVGLQIRQDQVLARAELGSRTGEIQIEIQQIFTERDFAQTWAKMLEHPENLSVAEKVQVEGFLNVAQESFFRECYLKDIGVFPGCEAVVRLHASLFFGSRYAQRWWKDNPMSGSFAWMNDVIANAEPYSVQE